MKHTPLFSKHIELGAKMAPFGGYEMPIEYSGITSEHLAVRNNAGLFDVSHMGEFLVKGKNAASFLQSITSNDIYKLKPGKIQYCYLPNGNGGIVDDLLIYQLVENEYLLVVNASNREKDWQWIQSHIIDGVEMIDESDSTSLLAIQGPKAEEILQTLTKVDLSEMAYYTFKYGDIDKFENVLISKTGYTGAGGFELYVKNEQAAELWDLLLEKGEPLEILPAGLGARDTLRLEMGYCLYGNDIDDTTSPIEAGLGWITKLTDDKKFKDVEVLKSQIKEGVSKKLIGFVMEERAIPRNGYAIVNDKNEEVGVVTSGTMSPILGKGIGLGYVKTEFAKNDETIFIAIRNKSVPAKVTKTPFV